MERQSKGFALEGIEGQKKIARIMASFQKNSSANFNFSKTINYEKSTIISKDTQGKIHQEKKEELPKSQVFSYFLENGSRITARPSGTEPKIKFYLNLTGTNKKSLNELETTILQKIDLLVQNTN